MPHSCIQLPTVTNPRVAADLAVGLSASPRIGNEMSQWPIITAEKTHLDIGKKRPNL